MTRLNWGKAIASKRAGSQGTIDATQDGKASADKKALRKWRKKIKARAKAEAKQ